MRKARDQNGGNVCQHECERYIREHVVDVFKGLGRLGAHNVR